MMSDTECDCAESGRATRMEHRDEDRSKVAIRPRELGLDTASEARAVAAFCLAIRRNLGMPPRWRTSLCNAQCLLGARRQIREVFLQGVIVKADREDRLGLRFDHPQPSSSVGSDPNWRSNAWGSSRCSP
jgi:hypothetical protein